LNNAETAENILPQTYFSETMQKITQKNRSRMTILEAFKLLFNQSEKKIYLFLPSLLKNQDHDKWIMRSSNSEIFATFALKRTSFHSNQIHHTVVNQINCDTFLPLFPLRTELKTKKLSNNSSLLTYWIRLHPIKNRSPNLLRIRTFCKQMSRRLNFIETKDTTLLMNVIDHSSFPQFHSCWNLVLK